MRATVVLDRFNCCAMAARDSPASRSLGAWSRPLIKLWAWDHLGLYGWTLPLLAANVTTAVLRRVAG
jgi:hypothetical protein